MKSCTRSPLEKVCNEILQNIELFGLVFKLLASDCRRDMGPLNSNWALVY